MPGPSRTPHSNCGTTMRVSLTDLPTQPPLPADVEPVAFAPEHDLATLDARNDTFAGHWGATAFTPEAWRHKVTGSKTFRPELSFVVVSPDGEVQAFVLSHVFAADEAATGVREQDVGWIGTRKAQRGKGIASGLLGHALQVGRAAGYERALLNVDFDNATARAGSVGAVRLPHRRRVARLHRACLTAAKSDGVGHLSRRTPDGNNLCVTQF